jgi:predicted RNA methylase
MIDYVRDRQRYWDGIYLRVDDLQVSWFEAEPAESMRLLRLAGVTSSDAVIDAGAGSSRLIESPWAQGFTDLTAVDVSPVALAKVAPEVEFGCSCADPMDRRGPVDMAPTAPLVGVA